MLKFIKSNGITLFFVSFLCLGCQSSERLSEAMPTDWELYKKEFFDDLWQTYPSWATGLGLSDYATAFKVPNALYRQEKLAFYNKQLSRLEQIPKGQLSKLDSMDYELIHNFLKSALWEENIFKSYEWDPSNYNLGNAFAAVLENSKISDLEKMNRLSERLSRVPEYYGAAIQNIKVPTREHTQLAIQQSEGLVTYLETEIKKRLEQSALDASAKLLAEQHRKVAVGAVQKYIVQLKDIKKTHEKKNNFRSFRIGKELYAQKFKFDLQSNMSAEQVYNLAVKTKKEIHQEMKKQAIALWPKYFPKTPPPAQPLVMIKKLIDKVADNHIKAEEFVSTVDKMLPQLNDFIVKKDLLTLDPKKPLKVRETPLYARGFAGASVDAPGPFDANRETYYNVTPLTDLPTAKQNSYLKEYNNYTLQILNIHEAIPGHYVQLVYNLKSPSLVKSIFGNSALIEGWAVYAERMMIEEGYGNNEPELLLMYNKWRLRVVCNTILDYSLHNLNMSKEGAVRLLRDEAFQEASQVDEKWNRATYSQVQLASYFTGFSEIYSLRETLKKQMGKSFDLKKFHETFLSYGSSPVGLIGQDMLSQSGANTNGEIR